MATPHASTETESTAAHGHGETRPELALVDPWYAYRGPVDPKFLELIGSQKDIYDALGGGEAFIKELRREPEDAQP
jgi:hypothetical protein